MCLCHLYSEYQSLGTPDEARSRWSQTLDHGLTTHASLILGEAKWMKVQTFGLAVWVFLMPPPSDNIRSCFAVGRIRDGLHLKNASTDTHLNSKANC